MTAWAFVAQAAMGAIRDGGIDPANLGKGDWVYSMTDATNKVGGHVSSVTNEASLMQFYKSQGIRYFLVKAGTSDQLFNGCYTHPQFTSNLVNTAHANGILIFGYNRSYGSNIVGEIAISDYVFNQGADGFVWDAEAEWETLAANSWITNGSLQAWQLCSAVRSNWPTKFLAHAPFPIIALHSTFPYKEFGYWSDAVMPQIYHFSSSGLKGSPSACINWSDVNWKSWQSSLVGASSVINGTTVFWTNSIKPILPLQDVYGPIIAGGVICEGTASAYADADVMEFIDYAAADPHAQTVGGYKGINFWRTDLHGAGQWANISAGTSGNFPRVVNNVVIDDANATAVTGGWTAVKVFGATTTAPTYYGATGTDTNSFGTNYYYKAQGTGSAYVEFTPTIAVQGDYDVYQWHPYRTDASASVPHLIIYNGGSTTVNANQQTNDGNWSRLGRWNFAAGNSGKIRVLDNFPEAAAVAMADGIKLVFVPPTNAPAAPSGLSADAVSSSQINLTWLDNATNEINYLVARGTASGGPFTNLDWLPANTTNFSSTNLNANTAYYYMVTATNSAGLSANSAQAFATTLGGAPVPPSITNQPQSQTVIAGQNASFAVAAAGSAPLSYQWKFNNAIIGSATNSTYTRANVQTNDAGQYLVVVTNAYGSTSSAPVTLTVNYALTLNAGPGGSISNSPNPASYTPGSTVSLMALPNSGFIFYGWGADAGGTNNPLLLTMTSNKSVTATFLNLGTDLILDNTNAAVTFTGTWQTGTSSVDKYGPDYNFAGTVAGGTSNVTYRPAIGTPGWYDVFIWYPQGSNRATNAPWSVFYFGGNTNVSVDQTTNGGGWRLIAGSRWFARGTNGYVRVANDTGYSGKVVLADAVRFTYSAVQPQSPQFQSIHLVSNGLVQLSLTGDPGSSSVLQVSTDLETWLDLTNLLDTNGIIQLIDPVAATNATRYYRTRSGP